MQYAEEPTIAHRVTLETKSSKGWQPHPAMIANMTRHEVWIRIEKDLGEAAYPERPVRLVLSRPGGGVQTAETSVLWHIGLDGLLVVLLRPTIWDPPSKRAHSRARLAIPASLYPDGVGPVSARTTNVGVGGFFCVSDGPVPAGSLLPISLLLTPAQSFDCTAEVVRVEENTDDPTGKQACLAFRFVDLSQDDQARLANALVSLTDDVDDEYVPLPWQGQMGTQLSA
jgi:hypothetical protein